MASLNVVRVKRKADEEPVETLVIALKRSKREHEESDEVFLKLATTFTSTADFNNDFLRNAITRDKLRKIQRRKSPKHVNSGSTFSMRLHIRKVEREQRRELELANRRLILAQNLSKEDDEESKNTEEGATSNSTEVRGMFKLYDIIEENEESKSVEQDEEKTSSQSSIMCNGVHLIRVNGSREDINEYVYDVYYVAGGDLDARFVDGSVSVQPCALNDDEFAYDSDEPEEYYEDEDDSNDECNWRNDYPDEDSESENDLDYYNDDENIDPAMYAMQQKFKKFAIDEEKLGRKYAIYKTVVLEGRENDDDLL